MNGRHKRLRFEVYYYIYRMCSKQVTKMCMYKYYDMYVCANIMCAFYSF